MNEIPGILTMETFGTGPVGFVIEVPHGADETEHFVSMASRLSGKLPDGLADFFHVNTDVGAYALGRAVGEKLAAAGKSVVVIRCLIPRTLVDCNRVLDGPAEDGLTPGLPPYITDADDSAWLVSRHGRYVEAVREVMEQVLDAGGMALLPHTYSPRSVGIKTVDADIVKNLHWAYEPERFATWPVRAEVDLILSDADGKDLSPPGLAGRIEELLQADGVQVERDGTYWLHPVAQGAQWAMRWPGQVLTLEVRRDLLVERWDPFGPMRADPAKVERFAAPIASAILH